MPTAPCVLLLAPLLIFRYWSKYASPGNELSVAELGTLDFTKNGGSKQLGQFLFTTDPLFPGCGTKVAYFAPVKPQLQCKAANHFTRITFG